MATAKSAIDTDLVRELAALVGETGLAEIEVEKGDLRIRVVRHTAVAAAAPTVVTVAPSAPLQMAAAPPAAPTARADHPGAVPSPMVGTAYVRPTPEAKAFVEIGSSVKAGDKLLLIEAMKTFNDVIAPKSGVITQIFVDDKQPVEFGEILMIIE